MKTILKNPNVLGEILFSTPFSLEINFLLANILIESSRTTIRYRSERKMNIVSLLEFYIDYLARKKYKQILIHNITIIRIRSSLWAKK